MDADANHRDAAPRDAHHIPRCGQLETGGSHQRRCRAFTTRASAEGTRRRTSHVSLPQSSVRAFVVSRGRGHGSGLNELRLFLHRVIVCRFELTFDLGHAIAQPRDILAESSDLDVAPSRFRGGAGGGVGFGP